MASSPTNVETRWHDSAWLADAVAWVDAALAERGLERSGEVDQQHAYPWATAVLVPLGETRVWFKACIPELAHEIAVLELLGSRRPDVVPAVLAADRGRAWMLLEDAGEQLRRAYDPPRIEHWEEAVALYAQLQIDATADVDAFVAAGVPDRRGARYGEQLEAVVADERMLTERPGEALTDDELAELRALVPRLAAEAVELETLGLPASIQHDDLHDGNVFVHDGGYRIIDWGDASVSNPLYSLSVAISVVAHRFGSDYDSAEVQRVRDAFLEPWTAFVPRDELLAAMDSVIRVAYAAVSIKWHEVMRLLTVDEREPFVGHLALRLRRLLELCA